MAPILFTVGSISGFLGVMLGAFAAHALKNRLAPDMFQIFEAGVRYQMYHTFAIFIAGGALSKWERPGFAAAGWLFLSGVIIFSGSLYSLSLSGIRGLGAVTPVGGLLFLLGWVLLGWNFCKV